MLAAMGEVAIVAREYWRACRRAVVIATAALTLLPFVGTARADDRAVCMDWGGVPEVTIAACSRLMAIEGLAPSFRSMLHLRRGYAFFQKADYEQVIRDYSFALVLEPRHQLALSLRGEAHLMIGEHAKALADFDALIALNPAYHWVWYNRGRANEGLGNSDEAMCDYRNALIRVPEDDDAIVGMGVVLFGKGEMEAALAHFTRALELDPANADAAYDRAVTNERLKNRAAALSDYSLALAIDPGRGDAAYWRGMLHAGFGDNRKALEDIAYAIVHDRENEADYRDASCWLRAERNLGLETALAECERAIALAPGNGSFKANRIFVYMKLGRFEAARNEADALMRDKLESADVLYMRGLARVRLGDVEGGDNDIARALTRDPDVAYRFQSWGLGR